MTDVASRLRITFDNGVTIRGCYRHTAKTLVAVELTVTDSDGGYLYTIRRTLRGMDGFTAVVTTMQETKEYLLACEINKFRGSAGMEVIKGVLLAAEKTYRIAA